MNGGPHILVSPDGAQFMLDVNSGKYYAITTLNQQHMATKYNSSYDPLLPPLIPIDQVELVRGNIAQQRNYSQSKKSSNQPPSKATLQNRDKNQHIHQKHASTWHKNVEQDAPKLIQRTTMQTEQTSTPQDTEQIISEDNGEEEIDILPTTYDNQQEKMSVINKRALNDSDEAITARSNKSRKNDHSEENVANPGDYNIPLEHLQRAVTHNLPCFLIKFQTVNKLPSAVTASEELLDHFRKQGIKINNGFSVVRYVGTQLKVGVTDKEDYLILNNNKIWPAKVRDNPITINFPKFIPEQFSLVVRFIPQDFSVDLVESEVKRSACSANNFRAIVYPYSRATKDFRFSVADQSEYNGLLHLGRIGVGNRMHPITQYRPANKLTYCTKCWVLGHTRNQCRYHVQKCRICLLDFNDKHNEVCSKVYQCAQCHQNHFSLDGDCKGVQHYRNNLNRAVKQATKDGKINVPSTTPFNPPTTSPPPMNIQSHPPLPLPKAPSRYNNNSNPWGKATSTVPSNNHSNDISNQQLFDKICVHFDDKLKQVDACILKLDQATTTNNAMIMDVRRSVASVTGLFKQLVDDILVPMIKAIPNGDKKTKSSLGKNIAIFGAEVDRIQKESCVEVNSQTELSETTEQSNLTSNQNEQYA